MGGGGGGGGGVVSVLLHTDELRLKPLDSFFRFLKKLRGK